MRRRSMSLTARRRQFVMPLVIPMNTSSRSISSSLSIFKRKAALDQHLGDEAAVAECRRCSVTSR